MLKLLVLFAIISVAVGEQANWKDYAYCAAVGGAVGLAALPAAGIAIGVTASGPVSAGLFASA